MRRIKKALRQCVTALIFMPVGLSAYAAESDANWPCIQRKVEHLSPAQMWPYPIESGNIDQAGQELGTQLALRRFDRADMEILIENFVNSQGNTNTDQLGGIYAVTFDALEARRSVILEGIARYNEGQFERGERIDALREEFATIEEQDMPDYDRLDALEKQIDWESRIFRERAQSLVYLCETPVLIERHAYQVAQALLQFAK